MFEAGLGARPDELAGSHAGQASFPITTKVGTISFTSPRPDRGEHAGRARAGPDFTIGAEQVAKSPADGYTLMLTAKLTLVTVPHLYEKFHTTHCGILRRLQRSFPQPRLWSPILRCRLRQ